MSVIEIMEQFLEHSDWIDMTRMLEPGMPNWPTQPPFSAVTNEALEWGDGSYHRTITMSEHTGTHMDAGCHFVPGTKSIDQVPITQIMGRAVNIDATDTAPRGDFTLDKLKEFEHNYGEIKAGDIVFFRFGWDEKYDLKPADKAYNKDWPGISTEVGEYLKEKQVKAVGCDCMALDADGTTYPNHGILLENDINILENVDKLYELPRFFAVIGFPCRIKDGSGSTLRLIAFVDKK